MVLHLIKNPQPDLTVKEFLIKLSRLISLRKTRMLLVVATVLVILSMAGIPPGMGFLPKAYLFFLLYKQGDLFLFMLVFCLNLISLGYYLRMSRFLLFDAELNREPTETFSPIPKNVVWIMVIMFILSLLFCYILVEGVNLLLLQDVLTLDEFQLSPPPKSLDFLAKDYDTWTGTIHHRNYTPTSTYHMSLKRQAILDALRSQLPKE